MLLSVLAVNNDGTFVWPVIPHIVVGIPLASPVGALRKHSKIWGDLSSVLQVSSDPVISVMVSLWLEVQGTHL